MGALRRQARDDVDDGCDGLFYTAAEFIFADPKDFFCGKGEQILNGFLRCSRVGWSSFISHLK